MNPAALAECGHAACPLSALVAKRPLVLCDLWGVLHDGREAFPEAVAALEAARRTGCDVVLISNSPERDDIVEGKLARLGIRRGLSHDGLITSGTLGRNLLARDFAGKRIFLLGPQEDAPTLEGLKIARAEAPDDADVLFATGLLFEKAEDHQAMLSEPARRGIPMICANPDRIVRHAGRMEICAGAVADLYESLGGRVLWMGKPAAVPFETARRDHAARRGSFPDWRDMLMIGDSLATDIRGANALGIPSLLILSGIHRDALDAGEPLADLCARHRATPDHVADRLFWGH
ncbi:MAG: TIGR01459 family HAD-type hydrolase [Rhodothalassiaceae bacterium]